MKCSICDREMTETDIVWNKDTKEFEPCPVCLDVIWETAYSGGFLKEDAVPTLEGEEYRSYFDHSDASYSPEEGYE